MCMLLCSDHVCSSNGSFMRCVDSSNLNPNLSFAWLWNGNPDPHSHLTMLLIRYVRMCVFRGLHVQTVDTDRDDDVLTCSGKI